MNNRQKAKHFKKLYETTLPKFNSVKVSNQPLVYHRVEKMLRKMDCLRVEDNLWLENEVINSILNDIKPYIRENIVCHRDDITDSFRYSLDVFFIRKDENEKSMLL